MKIPTPLRTALPYLIIAVALFAALLLRHFALHPGAGYIRMGYDEQGKYVLVVSESPAVLRELRVNGEVVAEHLFVPGGLKVRYNWKSGRRYRVVAKLDSGRLTASVVPPPLTPELRVSAHAYTLANGDTTVLLRLRSAEYDRVEVIRAAYLPERVRILDYPAVGVSQSDVSDFYAALAELFRRTGVRVEYVQTPRVDERSVLVIASGVMPRDDEFLQRVRSSRWGKCRVVYLGMIPGAVVVDQSGNVDTSNPFPGTVVGQSTVATGTIRMKVSSYTSTAGTALVPRADGLPAVYRTGCVLVFSNTVSRGWESPRDAAWDVFRAVITDGGFGAPVWSAEPGGDVATAVVQLNTSASELLALAYRGSELAKVRRINVPQPGRMLDAEVRFLENLLPGSRSAVVSLTLPQGVRGDARVLATNLDTGETLVTELGKAAPGKNTYRAEVRLPPGRVLLVVEAGGMMSRAEVLHVPVLMATAEPTREGFIVTVTENGEPYSGELEVETPSRGRGRIEVRDGKLLVRDSKFSIYVDGYMVPVSYAQPPTAKPWLSTVIAAIVVLAALATLLLVRERYGRTVRVVFRVTESKQDMRITASKVLAAFYQYSKHMGIEYLPLSIEEVKQAVGMYVTRGTMPSLRATRALLRKMSALEGAWQIREAYGYYAPVAWERETGQSVEHLAMIRVVYEWAVSRGYFARPLPHRNYSQEGYPDLVLTDRKRLVYVEVVSGRTRKPLRQTLERYMRWAKELRTLDGKGHGLEDTLMVVLPDDLYREYRAAIDEGSWESAVAFRALEEEGALRVVSITQLTRA